MLRPGRPHRGRARVDRAYAVDRRSYARISALIQLVRPLGPAVGVGVSEASLHRIGRHADAAVQVADVEQRYPESGFARALGDRLAHSVRVSVRLAVRTVV